jgi:hypothetical protein
MTSGRGQFGRMLGGGMPAGMPPGINGPGGPSMRQIPMPARRKDKKKKKKRR